MTVSATESSGFLHQMEARPTDGIRVVSEFPDDFPEDLPEEGRGVDENIGAHFNVVKNIIFSKKYVRVLCNTLI